MLISTILETFKFFKRNEDGSIDKSSVEFEINNRLYRVLDLEELKQLIYENVWSCGKNEICGRDNTEYEYSKKYPYFKSFYRVSEGKILKTWIKDKKCIIVEFDKDELMKLRNVTFIPCLHHASPKIKKLYIIAKKYDFNRKDIKKDKFNYFKDNKVLKDRCLSMLGILKNIKSFEDITETDDNGNEWISDAKFIKTRPNEYTVFEDRLISKVRNIQLPSDKSKLIKRIWYSDKNEKNMLSKDLIQKIKSFNDGVIEIKKVNFENLQSHNQLYTPEYQESSRNTHKKQQIQLNEKFNNLIKQINEIILPIISKENISKKENARLNSFCDELFKELNKNYYENWYKLNFTPKKVLKNNKNLIEEYNKKVLENNSFIKEYKDVIQKLCSLSYLCKERLNNYNKNIEKYNNQLKKKKIDNFDLEKILV